MIPLFIGVTAERILDITIWEIPGTDIIYIINKQGLNVLELSVSLVYIFMLNNSIIYHRVVQRIPQVIHKVGLQTLRVKGYRSGILLAHYHSRL